MNETERPPKREADPRAELTRAMTPFVESALKTSVQRNPRPLVEVLVPLMGPAIRRAIGDALRSMVQALENVLNVGFSRRGIAWRFEAWRSGRRFAEVAFLHSLLFRVEATLLVHRKTGHLLLQVGSEKALAEPELVSAMTVALQDFVEDSFRERLTTGETDLRTIQVGELTIWIEHAPLASLVAIIRGHPPESLRAQLEEALTAFEGTHREALESFAGDVTPFAGGEESLSHLLVEEVKPRPKRSPLKAYAVLAALAAIALALIGAGTARARNWRKFVAQLDQTPGLVVIDAERERGRYVVRGLRDPYAEDPRQVLARTRINANKVAFEMRPFVSLEPAPLVARFRDVLRAPDGVTLRAERGQVVVGGHAPLAWIQEARAQARTLADLGLTWREDQLVSDESIRLGEVAELLRRHSLVFEYGESEIDPDAEAELRAMASELRELEWLARATGRDAAVVIVGSASFEGTPRHDLRLSRARAESVQRQLIALEVPPQLLRAEGRGVTPAGRRVELLVRT